MLWEWQRKLVQQALKLGNKLFPIRSTGKSNLPVIEDETAVYQKRPKPIEVETESEHFGTPIRESRIHRRGRPRIVDIVLPNDSEIKRLLQQKKTLLYQVGDTVVGTGVGTYGVTYRGVIYAIQPEYHYLRIKSKEGYYATLDTRNQHTRRVDP